MKVTPPGIAGEVEVTPDRVQDRPGGAVALLNLVPAPIARRFAQSSAVSRLLRPVVNHLVPVRPTWVVVRAGPARGTRLLIEPHSEKYYWTGLYEKPIQEALESWLRPGMTYWDVGAHIGFFTALASRLVGDAGSVHSFEPFRPNFERLRLTIEANELNNVGTYNAALSSQCGSIQVNEGRHTSMATTSVAPITADRVGAPLTTVASFTLDALADLHGRPDVIKVDVEGAEIDVLEGGQALLQSPRPPRLIVEFHDLALRSEAETQLGLRFKALSARHWTLE